MAWAQSPPNPSPTEELDAPLPGTCECALRSQASPPVPSRQDVLCLLPHGSPCPSPWPWGEGPVCRWGHTYGCIAEDPTVRAPSCLSEQATQLLILPRNQHGSPCAATTPTRRARCEGVRLLLQENGEPVFGLGAGPRRLLCAVPPGSVYLADSSLSPRLDEWLFHRLGEWPAPRPL